MGLASTLPTDLGKQSKDHPVAKSLEEVEVLPVDESPREVGALIVAESPVEVGVFLLLGREFVDLHGYLPYLKLNFCPSSNKGRQLLLS